MTTPLPLKVTFLPDPEQCVHLGVGYTADGYDVEVPANCPYPLRGALARAMIKYPSRPMLVAAPDVIGNWAASITLAAHANTRPPMIEWITNGTPRGALYSVVLQICGVTWRDILSTYEALMREHERSLATQGDV